MTFLNCFQKVGVLLSFPTPRSHNVLIGSQRVSTLTKQKSKNAKHNEVYKNTTPDANVNNLTPNSKTQPHPFNYKVTHIFKSNTTNNKYTQTQKHHQ